VGCGESKSLFKMLVVVLPVTRGEKGVGEYKERCAVLLLGGGKRSN